MEHDRVLYPDINAAARLIAGPELAAIASEG
jgi:hypothetical protein